MWKSVSVALGMIRDRDIFRVDVDRDAAGRRCGQFGRDEAVARKVKKDR